MSNQPPDRRNARDNPRVRELLAARPKDDPKPLFCPLPDHADDAEACAPNMQRAYAGPTSLKDGHHEAAQTARVELAPRVDPRKAPTTRIMLPEGAMSRPVSSRRPGGGAGWTVVLAASGAALVAAGALAIVSMRRPANPATVEAIATMVATVTTTSAATATATATPAATATESRTSTSVVPIAPPAAPKNTPRQADPYDAVPAVTAVPPQDAATQTPSARPPVFLPGGDNPYP